LNPHNTADFHCGWIQNISMGGIRVKTEIQPTHLAKEEEVTVFTNTNYFSFDAKGKVIWTSDIKGEVGIKFTQLAEEKRKSLEEFMKLFP
jgi:predicted mannosyl-3-phosphoglycerate phosphatase (HAD superfamily)